MEHVLRPANAILVFKKNVRGTKSKDSLMTITETAKKLLVNTYKYFFDRLSNRYIMPSLADLIRQRSVPMIVTPG